ncbi:hypothetical protein Shyhy02_14600 [Streptomyces hygroscopicus subsp. hygroscopicus]|nr:hypothetical protein Shyhy02_14600 [Streptomyces hygroscopicus subsp. hygroscopicus]
MWPALFPLALLAYCVTAVCITAIVVTRIALRDTAPTDRPSILRGVAHVIRGVADALRFWRRR